MKRDISKVMLTAATLVGALALAPSAFAAGTVYVNTPNDGDVNDSLCTLREAIKSINNNASYNGCVNPGGADVIELRAETVNLTSAPPASTTRPRTIRGQGYARTTINGNLTATHFQVSSSALNFHNLTLRNFFAAPLSISAGASSSLSYVKVVGSSDAGSGGCIYNAGSVSISNAQFELCRAFSGGVLFNAANASASITETTLLKNFGEHGVIYNASGASLSIQSSTIGANKSGNLSGAVYNRGGNVSIFASTLAYNTCTDSATCATNGAHHLSNDPAGGGTMSIELSVVYNEIGFGRDCYGTITSYGKNAYSSGMGCNFSASGDRSVTNARLNPITTSENGYVNTPREAGGVGRVYVPLSNSPLVAQVSGPTIFGDQRGTRRKASSNDIGAVQRGLALLVVGNTTLSAGDTVLKNNLETLGFTVTVRQDSSAVASDANGKTLVVISESVTSGNVGNKFRDTPVGVLVLELAVFDDMNMTTAANLGTLTASQVSLPWGSNANFLANKSGYYGNITVTSSAVSMGWGTPPSGPYLLAQDLTTPSRSLAFYCFAGAPMVGGFVAPGRRVGAFITDAAAASLQPAGVRLLQEAILLASGPTAF